MKPILVKSAIVFFLTCLFFFRACFFVSGQTLNAGFASSLWYSKDPFFVDEKIRIYTAFQNHSGFDLTGKVSFFDGENLIGETNFTAINNSLVEKWIDWQASFGNHIFSVKLSNIKKSEPGKEPEAVILEGQISSPSQKFVDYDTDHDGSGDDQDYDDDNDGLSDEREALFKTDPKASDTDKDVLADGYEVDQGTNPLVPERGLVAEKIVLPEQVQRATIDVLNFIERQREGAVVELDRILTEQKILGKTLTKNNLFIAGISLLLTAVKIDWLFWPLLIILALFCFKTMKFFLRRRPR